MQILTFSDHLVLNGGGVECLSEMNNSAEVGFAFKSEKMSQ